MLDPIAYKWKQKKAKKKIHPFANELNLMKNNISIIWLMLKTNQTKPNQTKQNKNFCKENEIKKIQRQCYSILTLRFLVRTDWQEKRLLIYIYIYKNIEKKIWRQRCTESKELQQRWEMVTNENGNYATIAPNIKTFLSLKPFLLEDV